MDLLVQPQDRVWQAGSPRKYDHLRPRHEILGLYQPLMLIRTSIVQITEVLLVDEWALQGREIWANCPHGHIQVWRTWAEEEAECRVASVCPLAAFRQDLEHTVNLEDQV